MAKKSLFDMDNEELQEFVRTTPAGQIGCGIHPDDAKKLAKKIKRKKITGKQLQGRDLNGIQNLLGSSWNAAIVQEFANCIEDKREEERAQVPGGPGGSAAIPQSFTVNVGGIGSSNITFTVNKSWTFRDFKERLYENEIGGLSTDTTKRPRELTNLNLTGVASKDYGVKYSFYLFNIYIYK